MWLLWWTEHLNHNNNKCCFAFDIYQENKHVFVANHFSQHSQQQQQQQQQQQHTMELWLFLHTAASSSPQDLENEGLFLIQGHARKIVRSKASRVDVFFFCRVRLGTSNVEQRFLGMGDWGVSRRVCSLHFFGFRKTTKAYVESWRKM